MIPLNDPIKQTGINMICEFLINKPKQLCVCVAEVHSTELFSTNK